MSRRVTEVVHVGVQNRRPTAFRWRGNRYVVHEVLGHWRERRAWWGGQGWGEPGTGPPRSAVGEIPAPRGWSSAVADEYEVWRVEAARSCGGLHAVAGVYDLCHDAASRPDIGSWRLLRIVD